MQVTHSPQDDPASCIEGPVTDRAVASPSAEEQGAWRKEFKGRLAARLAKLGSCARTLKKPGDMDVAFDLRADGTVEEVRVPSTTLSDCRALECVRHGLSELKAPPLPGSPERATLLIHSVTLPAGGANGAKRAEVTPYIGEGFDPNEATQSCVSADEQRPREPTTGAPNGSSAGRLPPEQIQALVRQHYGAFRHCYEAGLGRNSQLKGRVAIKFVIDTQGRVKDSHIEQNDLPDCSVARCVRDEMRAIQFPTPEGGDVTVVYPINLEPD
jgi:hypothetical protein